MKDGLSIRNIQKKEYKNGTFEEEMKKVLDYWREYQSFLEGKSLGENDNG